jgi:hypothetical protein
MSGQFYTLLLGDMNQMATQRQRLRQLGFDIADGSGIPGFRTERDFRRGVRLIWEEKIAGWCAYRTHLVEMEICTMAEYEEALRAEHPRS